MNGSFQDEKGISLRLALLFVVTASAAYYTTLDNYFLSDDFAQIGRVLEGDWSTTWGLETGGFFRPLFILSYILDASIWRENPFGYHLTNTILHGVNSLLVCRLAQRLLREVRLPVEAVRALALSAGLLFLLHPSHTESVSWISGRADLLCTALCLGATLLFISYRETRRAPYLISALISFALALLAKESAASLPLILFITGLYFAKSGPRKRALLEALKDAAPFFAALFLFILLRRLALGAWLGGYGAGQHLNFSPGWLWARFLQASLRSLVPALPQSFSTLFLKPLKSPVFLLSALAVAALVLLLVRRRRRAAKADERRAENRLLLFLAASFVLSLLPVINLRLSIFDTQGERFLYWPTAFSVMLITYLAFVLLRGKGLWLVAVLLLLAFYSVCLYRTNRTWAEAARLSRSIKEELAQSVTEGQSVIVLNLPDNLRGVPVYHNGFEEALLVFQKRSRVNARVLALHSLQSVDDGAQLKTEGDALSLGLLNGADEFTKVTQGLECVEGLESQGARFLRFRLGACAARPQLFLFNAGRTYRVISEAYTAGRP